MRRRISVLAAAALAGLAVAVSVGVAARSTDPGVTKNSIVIGGTYPLSGPAALYGTIPLAYKAYFDWFNSRSSIHGRKIKWIYYDDMYDPSQTVPLTQKLVEQDHVFAIVGSLGTAPNLAIRPYLNQHHVPQVLIATGDPFWSTQYKKYPWTIGGLGTYSGEAKLMAKFINQKIPQAKIGILYQNDAYGTVYLGALKRYLGAKGNAKIVDAEPFDVTAPDVVQQMLKLKSSGANLYYDIATPSPSIKSLVTAAKIGWHPAATIINAVSSSALFMNIAAKAGANIDGDISSTAGPNPNDPANANMPVIKQYKAIMAQYYPKGDVGDANNFASMGGAWVAIYALSHAGNPPTRKGLMRALTHLNIKNDPYLFKGERIVTTPTERFLYDQSKLERWSGQAGGLWKPFGPIVSGLRG
jgi:branched-chain amino acid transport system substrate-binding protein